MLTRAFDLVEGETCKCNKKGVKCYQFKFVKD